MLNLSLIIVISDDSQHFAKISSMHIRQFQRAGSRPAQSAVNQWCYCEEERDQQILRSSN